MDILLFCFGVWAIITARIPSWLIGGGKYRIEGTAVRIIGILFLMPVVVELIVVRFFPSTLSDFVGSTFGIIVLTTAIVVVISALIVRRVRKPIDTSIRA